MRKLTWWLVLVAAAGIVAIALYYALPKMRPEAPPAPSVAANPLPAPPPAAAQIRFPLDAGTAEPPLPALNESDAAIGQAVEALWSDKKFVRLLHLTEFIRRVVATIDNLPRGKLALRLLPIGPVGGKFLVTGTADARVISAANAVRYGLYVQMVEAVDVGKLAVVYRRFYPLVQQAYRELGYPDVYFNDRVVDVIDHLLATPEVQAPVKLIQPKVFYEFADPKLEACSAGQKILLRIGSQNAERIKVRLRQIRNEITDGTHAQ